MSDSAELAAIKARMSAGWPKDDRIYADRASLFRMLNEARHSFKNFHRLLCERFNYHHDEADWSRDQLSLIEHIARQIDEAKANAKQLDAARAINNVAIESWFIAAEQRDDLVMENKKLREALRKVTPASPTTLRDEIYK